MMNNTGDKDSCVYDVLGKVCPSVAPLKQKRSVYKLGGKVIHTRFKSKASSGNKFPYNINPQTLDADYELWVCGGNESWYLMPTSLMQQIYDDPEAYVDNAHPDIRVVTVDLDTHLLMYARGGQTMSVEAYYQKKL